MTNISKEGKGVYTTLGSNVLSSVVDADSTNLVPCSHEEADTRLLLHVADAVQEGLRKVCIRTVDTDVVVLAIAMFERINPEEFWIAFGTGSNFHYIPVHSIHSCCNGFKSVLFSMYSMFTGCDITSALAGRGKNTAFNTWKLFPEVTAAFEDLVHMQENIGETVKIYIWHEYCIRILLKCFSCPRMKHLDNSCTIKNLALNTGTFIS